MVIPVKFTDYKRVPTEKERNETFARLFSHRVITTNGCWEWTGYVNPFGYGEMSFQCDNWRVHRLSWLLHKGPLPPALYVCHTCDNRKCFNPEHMFLGDHLANQQDKHRKGRCPQKAKKTCPHGHPYDEENTYVCNRGFRACRTCQRIRQRVQAGWTQEQAETLEVTPHGQRPVNGHFKPKRKRDGLTENESDHG